jgi:hypothetical protein
MCRWEERRRCSLAAVRSAVRRAVGSLAQIGDDGRREKEIDCGVICTDFAVDVAVFEDVLVEREGWDAAVKGRGV